MSAPIRHPRDLDDPSIYAPRWLRESASPPLVEPEAPPPERVRNTLPPAATLPDLAYPRAPREAPREAPRDSQRDPQRDAQRELQHDPPRDAEQDAEASDGDIASHHLLMHQALRPQFLPEPPMPEGSHSFMGAAARILLAFTFVAGMVLLFVFGVLPFAQLTDATRAELASTTPLRGAAPSTAPAFRLVVEDLSGRVNEPLPLPISVTGSSAGAFVMIAGLAAGTRVTAGAPAGGREWRIPVRDLAKAVVLPPQDFTGTMKLAVDLWLNDESMADGRVMNLDWIAANRTGALPADIQPAQPVQLAQPVPAAPPRQPAVQAAPQPQSTDPSPAAKARRLDRDEIALLLKRGEELLSQGDVAAARLMLQRAADARDPRAALALGATYDPAMLSQLGVLGFQPDLTQARVWYERAAEMGSPDAPRRLDRLAQDNPR